jgi:hypothetical protein
VELCAVVQGHLSPGIDEQNPIYRTINGSEHIIIAVSSQVEKSYIHSTL